MKQALNVHTEYSWSDISSYNELPDLTNKPINEIKSIAKLYNLMYAYDNEGNYNNTKGNSIIDNRGNIVWDSKKELPNKLLIKELLPKKSVWFF